MEISNLYYKGLLRYFSNPNLFFLYTSSPFSKTLKPSSNPFRTSRHTKTICNFDLDLLNNEPSSCSYSSEMLSKCNLDLHSFLNKPTVLSSSSRPPSNCNVDSYPFLKIPSLFSSSYSLLSVSNFYFDSYPLHNRQSISSPTTTCWFYNSSCIGLSRCFSVQRHDGTMIHNKSRESENLKIAKSGESRRNSKNISYPAFDEVTKIIEFIRSDGEDLRSKLSSVAPALDSRPIIRDTFKVLNQLRISGLMFFRILLEMNPKLSKSGDVCSMIINNCGWLGDYEVMLSLLEEFKLENICLTQMAFEFLPVFKPSKNSVMESTRRVVDVLNKVGGSCRNSGITALIEKFCSLNSFQMAKFVIQITEMSVSRYNILIRARCKRGQIEEARAIIQEMVELGFLPDATTHNYLLAYLCKNNRMDEACNVLNEMKEKGFHPNAITFEALIFHSSIRGQLDVAARYLDWMVMGNIEPRRATHSAFLKALFQTNQREKAYKYVNYLSAKFNTSSNMLYNLLAELHLKNGDPMTAKNIINEMMEKDLMPNSSIYFQCEATSKE
nr:pentatricopeptide repeat-containing protein At1g52640, mitochondrial-like [Ipomoea batatas]